MAFFLRKINNNDNDLSRVQDNVDAQLSKLNMVPFLSGVLLNGVVLTTSDTPVNHGLGRTAQGYLVLKRSANAVVFDGVTPSTSPSLWLTLRASAPVTVNLWVF